MSAPDSNLPFSGTFDDATMRIICEGHLERRQFIAMLGEMGANLSKNDVLSLKVTQGDYGIETGLEVTLTKEEIDRWIFASLAEDRQQPLPGIDRQQPPPAVAEFLLKLCATSKRADAALGDMNERYARECLEYGTRRATRRYWAETLRSLLPLLMHTIRRSVTWAIFVGIIKRHLLG